MLQGRGRRRLDGGGRWRLRRGSIGFRIEIEGDDG
jgi:hypothetical protein